MGLEGSHGSSLGTSRRPQRPPVHTATGRVLGGAHGGMMQGLPRSSQALTRASMDCASLAGTARPEHSRAQHSPSGTRVMVQSSSLRHSADCDCSGRSFDAVGGGGGPASWRSASRGGVGAGAATVVLPLSGDAASSGRLTGSTERAQPRDSRREHSSREGRMRSIVSPERCPFQEGVREARPTCCRGEAPPGVARTGPLLQGLTGSRS